MPRVQLVRGKYYADAWVMLNARTTPVAFAPRRVSQFISLVSAQTYEHCVGNT